MYVGIIGTILCFSLLIGHAISKVGRKNDELGKLILQKSLSKSMLLTIGILFLGLFASFIGAVTEIDFLKFDGHLWSLLVVILVSIFTNIQLETRKYLKNEE